LGIKEGVAAYGGANAVLGQVRRLSSAEDTPSVSKERRFLMLRESMVVKRLK
jgi:hypothetical protein